MRQTAVEWLAKELYEKFEIKEDNILFDEFLKQAKEMEKQQIIDAYETSHISMMTSKQYYNETFK